jgi:hypothetical protein
MWRDILNYRPFLEDMAKYWILPTAARYILGKYRARLAGGNVERHPQLQALLS